MGQLYQIVPLQEGSDYQGQNVGQVIQSVIIDNITPSWLYIAAANRYVPPLTWGVVFLAVANAQNTACNWRTPPGQLSAKTNNLGTAQVIFTDDYIAPSSGVSLLTPSQDIHVASFLGPGSLNVSPPPGTNTLILVSNVGQTYQVLGQNTLAHYYNGSSGPVVFVPIDMGSDTTYLITASGAGEVYIDASFVVQGVQVTNTPSVNIAEVGGSLIPEPYLTPVVPVLPYPDFYTYNGSIALVANVGQSIAAAPGAGSSWVLDKLYLSVGVPAATTTLKIGTSSGDSSLGTINFYNVPAEVHIPPVDYNNKLIGDNLPIFLTATNALTVAYIAMMKFVSTPAWPQG